MPIEPEVNLNMRFSRGAAKTPAPPTWRLSWAFGCAEVQPLGGMLGPASFRLASGRSLQVMHVADWAGQPGSMGLPGVLRRLRGEWPCVPFGRCDAPNDLPPGWQTMTAGDAWSHGYGANQLWTCVSASAEEVHLALDYPDAAPVARIERHIRAVPDAPALELSLTVQPRRSVTLPLGLHPTFTLAGQPGRVRLELGAHRGIFSYPSRKAGDVSLLLPDCRANSLSALPGVDGPIDLSRLPLHADCEELLQVHGLAAADARAPLQLHYLDHGAIIDLCWQTEHLPDLMLWVSNRGRRDFPWLGRHLALGVEPVHSIFDLGRVARPPDGHPLADRLGVALQAGQEWTTRYRIAARSLTTPASD